MIDDTLDARHKTYGSFTDVAGTAYAIRNVIEAELEARGKVLDPDMLLATEMITVKFARLINGDARHADGWHDIAGYAQLVADRLNGKTR